MLAELILAILIVIAPPGRSPYSVVVAQQADPPPCAEASSPLCRRPWWSDAHGSYVRVETAAEGLERYWTIARAIDAAAIEFAADVSGRTALARRLITVAWHESGLRRDVHEGIGAHAIGDEGRSYCLGQIMYGENSPVGRQLCGTDYDATLRCLRAVAFRLERARLNCGARVSDACIIQGYGAVRRPTDRRVLRRLATLNRVRELWGTRLDEATRGALGLGPAGGGQALAR